jgi:hypothetical protein
MRRWAIVAMLGALGLAAMSGCGGLAGLDGKLVDDWGPMGEPAIARPAAGDCFVAAGSGAAADLTTASLKEVSCGSEHTSETVYAADFVGAGGTVPAAGSTAMRRAFTACDAGARTYLGDNWRAGRLRLLLLPASKKQWEGGARFYRCDVVETTGESGQPVNRSQSVKDGLRDPKPLGVRCVNDVGKDADSVDGINFVDCAAKHTAEFSGVFTVTPPGKAYPGQTNLQKTLLDGCEKLAARYLGLATTDIPKGLAWLTWGLSKADWQGGDQAVRCYVGVYDRSHPIGAGATIKGLGTRPIPR